MLYDYIVIGAGSGGVRFARLMASDGKKVCIIENSRVGGTCVIRGCVPKKLYVYASNFNDYLTDAKSFGWKLGKCKHDWKNLVSKKNKEISRLNKIYIKNLKKAGVTIFQDHASFQNSNTVFLKKLKKKLKGKKIIIATGSKPNYPKIPGSNLGISSDEFFELKQLPKIISIVGSGYIALEFAFLLKNLGYVINLIIRKKTILNEFDPDIGQRILQSAKKKGIKVFEETSLKEVRKKGNFLEVKTSKKTIKTNLLIYAIGRSPNLSTLNLSRTKAKIKNNAIAVNKNSKTHDSNIFAIGDVTNRKNLTPVAIREAMILFDYLRDKKNRYSLDYNKVASAIFAQPEVGSIGFGENDLIRLRKKYKVLFTEFNPLKYAFQKNKKNKVFIKVMYEPKTEKVLGIIYIGDAAAEIIQTLAIPFTKGMYLSDIKQTVPVHPTSSEELITIF
ncbi:MAG: FAD-dependent oxidoreductase [Pelagibacteraceae bacterium]